MTLSVRKTNTSSDLSLWKIFEKENWHLSSSKCRGKKQNTTGCKNALRAEDIWEICRRCFCKSICRTPLTMHVHIVQSQLTETDHNAGSIMSECKTCSWSVLYILRLSSSYPFTVLALRSLGRRLRWLLPDLHACLGRIHLQSMYEYKI